MNRNPTEKKTDTENTCSSTTADAASTAVAVNAKTNRCRDVPHGPLWILRDSWTEALRHLRILPRTVDLMIFAIFQPVMFVVLFVYVFGNSITVPEFDYKQYLLPGIFAQTIVFGSSFTGAGIAQDMAQGLVQRLRSLPMSQSAVLIGRTISDLIRNSVTFVVMLLVGFAVGFRFNGSIGDTLVACGLLLGFGYAFSWIQALIGLSVSSVETVQSAGFMWMFPVTFVSSAFVDTQTLAGPLHWFADINPFTIVTNAGRALFNGQSPGNDLWFSLIWAVAIILVFCFLSVYRFSRFNR
ncbi:MAG: ABC transporter permease [Acidimicrobiaceae bacterium]|nr:ABC transporter permease [Acidimicrobiaceae bacterium]MDE0268476.1 ABC transporter permease [Acidimicrobiaceae bacterium]